MYKPVWSKLVFFCVIILAFFRDFMTDDTNMELNVYVLTGMAVAATIRYLFEQPNPLEEKK